jgi:hypothetical protein
LVKPAAARGIAPSPFRVLERLPADWRCIPVGTRKLKMPRYFFDVKNGHRLIDPAGLDCRDDQEAREPSSSRDKSQWMRPTLPGGDT